MIRIRMDFVDFIGKSESFVITHLTFPQRKTQLWSILLDHDWIWEHPEISICLIKLAKEWRRDRRGGTLW